MSYECDLGMDVPVKYKEAKEGNRDRRANSFKTEHTWGCSSAQGVGCVHPLKQLCRVTRSKLLAQGCLSATDFLSCVKQPCAISTSLTFALGSNVLTVIVLFNIVRYLS